MKPGFFTSGFETSQWPWRLCWEVFFLQQQKQPPSGAAHWVSVSFLREASRLKKPQCPTHSWSSGWWSLLSLSDMHTSGGTSGLYWWGGLPGACHWIGSQNVVPTTDTSYVARKGRYFPCSTRVCSSLGLFLVQKFRSWMSLPVSIVSCLFCREWYLAVTSYLSYSNMWKHIFGGQLILSRHCQKLECFAP